MDLIPNILNNSSIKDFSNSYNIFNSYSEINEGNDSSYEGYLRTDNFNFPNFNEISKTEGPTNNITNEERYNIQIPQRRNKITFNITSTQLGRKRKSDTSKRGHTKFSDDNIIRKIKVILLNAIYDHCNNKIRTIYENNVGLKKQKQLLKINSEQIKQSTVKFNKNFLNKKLKNIFSENICKRYENYRLDYNKNLIEDLLNEKDEIKKTQFENLFNLTFLDCLKHFRGIKTFPELIDMTLFEEACKQFENEDDYKDYKIFLEYYTEYLEDIINIKKQRNRNPLIVSIVR